MSGCVLLTGFDAFRGLESNPSSELVALLAEEGGPSLRTAILPTSFRRSGLALETLLEEHRPACILMLGYGRVEGLRLERWARNRDNPASIDNDGVAGGAKIVPGGPRFLRARAPLRSLRRQLLRAGVPAEISKNAGGFVCNHAFYYALNSVRRGRRMRKCIFAHVGDWQGSADEPHIVAGAQILLAYCLEAAGSRD